jgi:regulator of RNase E activity RraA
MTEIAAGTMESLRATTTATLTTQLFRRGFRNVFLQGVRPLKRYEANLVGPAFTLRYIPAREDLDAHGANPDPNALQREAIEAVPPGHVLVMDCRGEARVASAGDIYMTRLRARGVAGVVSDGGRRNREDRVAGLLRHPERSTQPDPAPHVGLQSPDRLWGRCGVSR